MSENMVITLLAVLCAILLLVCLLIVVFRDTSESADNVLEDGREAVQMAQRFNVTQERLNAECRAFVATPGSGCSCEMER